MNKWHGFKKKNRWDKLFSEGSIIKAQESQMRPKEELDEIVQNILKGQDNVDKIRK